MIYGGRVLWASCLGSLVRLVHLVPCHFANVRGVKPFFNVKQAAHMLRRLSTSGMWAACVVWVIAVFLKIREEVCQ